MDLVDVVLMSLGFGVAAFFTTLCVTPHVMTLASNRGFVDHPSRRKQHSSPTPVLGGAAVYVPIGLTLCALMVLAALEAGSRRWPSVVQIASMFLATTWILFLGTWDDRKPLSWIEKLGGQVLGIFILVIGGHSARSASLPWIGPVDFGWTGVIVLGLIVVTIANAMNLIDGLDGLAACMGFFAALASGVTGILKGDPFAATLGFVISGSLLGFLRFNWPPASIFLGDGGSLMLGFLLATMATSAATTGSPGQRSATFATLIGPFLPFSLALIDVALAVLRRWIRGRHFYLPDTDHLHHRLLAEFKDQKSVVLILCAFSAASAATGIWLSVRPPLAVDPSLVGAMAVVACALTAGLLKLYRPTNLSRAVHDREHFRFLEVYLSYVRAKVAAERSLLDVVSLLETGVKDLHFDSVEISVDGRVLRRWTCHKLVHPSSRRSQLVKELGGTGIVVRATIPQHDRSSYQYCLEQTWMDFLEVLHSRVLELGMETCHVQEPTLLSERQS